MVSDPDRLPAGVRPGRGWLFWGLGVFAYSIAVFHRSSLGVAGIDAQHRFGASAAVLSLFSVMQLAVYAAMQIPVGVLLDRFGPRRMVVTGGLLMAAGQLTLALADTVPAAIAARVLVGAGDAMTFISVLRLVPAWFAPRRVPVISQLTGILGQVGQIAATFPLVAALHGVGWTRTFGAVAAVGLLVAGLVAVTLRDSPPGTAHPVAAGPGVRRDALIRAWQEPGTRLGLWTHFVSQFPGAVFGLFWGYPFLVAGEGLRPTQATVLLTVLVLAAMVFGPLLGHLAGRWPMRRSAVVLGIVGASVTVWTLVLAWPGRAPLPLLVLLVLVLASNGPGSMVGFDFARTENPAARLGSASGIVNVGGFVASLTTILAVGVLLNLAGAGQATAAGSALGAYKLAFLVQYPVWAVGVAGLVLTRRQLRRQLAARGVHVVPLPRAMVRRLSPARSHS